MTKCEMCGNEFQGLAYKVYKPTKLYACKSCFVLDKIENYVSTTQPECRPYDCGFDEWVNKLRELIVGAE